MRGHRARETQRGPEGGRRAGPSVRQSRKRGRRLLPVSVLSPLPTDHRHWLLPCLDVPQHVILVARASIDTRSPA